MSTAWKFPDDVRGWLTEVEGHALAELARGRRVLEIGSYCGRSTICMGQTAARMHCIDWFGGDEGAGYGWTLPEFLDNLRRYDLKEKVIVHVGRSALIGDVLRDDSFDCVFVDGAHDAPSVTADLKLATRVLRAGGALAMHDWPMPGVRQAARSVLGITDGAMFDSLCVVKWKGRK